MTAYWIYLLVASVTVGAGVVGAMALPRHAAPLAVLTAIIAAALGIFSLRVLASGYGTTQAVLVALLFGIVGISAGYMIAAAALPHLASGTADAAIMFSEDAVTDAIVVLALTEPERYSPRAVATLQNLFSDHPAGGLPPVALPLVFMATRARYQAAGGASPAAPLTRSLVARISAIIAERHPGMPVAVAWAHTPDDLALAVRTLASNGASHISVVTLGSPDLGTAALARATLAQMIDRADASRIRFAPSIWTHRTLSAHTADRILAAAQAMPHEAIGVVLVGFGFPDDEGPHAKDAMRIEHCFDQRVKVLLCEAGFAEGHVRQAWLDWQDPDVTEAVRHVAALGCTRVLVAPSTIPMPTIETTLDLETAVSLARVPEGVHVMTLAPLGDADVLAQAVVSSALESLGLPTADGCDHPDED